MEKKVFKNLSTADHGSLLIEYVIKTTGPAANFAV